MKASYSEDLRKTEIVEALRQDRTKSEAARAFGVSRSSVERYAQLGEQGPRLLAPKKRFGSKPKVDGRARRLLEADPEERPAAIPSPSGAGTSGGWPVSRSASPP